MIIGVKNGILELNSSNDFLTNNYFVNSDAKML